MKSNVDYPLSEAWKKVLYKKNHPARQFVEHLISELSTNDIKPDMTDIARALTFAHIEPDGTLDELEAMLACAKWGMIVAKSSKDALAQEKGTVTALKNHIDQLNQTIQHWKDQYVALKDQVRQRLHDVGPVAGALGDLAFTEVDAQLWGHLQSNFRQLAIEINVLWNKAA
jgi:hypothetical protein